MSWKNITDLLKASYINVYWIIKKSKMKVGRIVDFNKNNLNYKKRLIKLKTKKSRVY